MKILKLLKFLEINYFTAFFGFALFLEIIYWSHNSFLSVLAFFIFSIIAMRKFSKSFPSFVLTFSFLISAVVLMPVYDGMVIQFLIIGLSLSFLILIFSFFNYYNFCPESASDWEFHLQLYDFAKFLIIFFWFLGYFNGRFDGIIFRNLISIILVYFVLDGQIYLGTEFSDTDSKMVKNIIILTLILVLVEIGLVLNFIIAGGEIKAMIFSFCYILVSKAILNRIKITEAVELRV